MFDPRFTYTERLVGNIAKISQLTSLIGNRRFSYPVLAELKKQAKVLSAHSSTSIEGNPLPLTIVKEVIKADPQNTQRSEREVINYNRALILLEFVLAADKNTPLSDELIFDTQWKVLEGLEAEHYTGKYRDQPVFVNDPSIQQTIYWPPDYQDVPRLMDELLEYVEKSLPAVNYLVVAGIFHKQFVVIHPFLDGNGRTVRLMTSFLLARMGLGISQLFSFENYYNQNVSKYFQKVGLRGDYYEQSKSLDFTEWLEYFTDGIIDELERVSKLLGRAVDLDTRLEKHHQKLLQLLEKSGVVKDSDYAKMTRRSRAARLIDFNHLIALGLIKRHGKGPGTYYKLNDDA